MSTWSALAVTVTCGVVLRCLRKTQLVFYRTEIGPACFCIPRPLMAVKGVLKGILISALPTGVMIGLFGALASGTSLLLSFLLGTVTNSWLIRKWSALDRCQDCAQVSDCLQSLQMAAVSLGVVLIIAVLNLIFTR